MNCPSKNYDPDTMLCSPGGKTNTCRGDSGGPLVANFDGVYQVFGVTSFGAPNCTAPAWGYFTKVQAYLNWIRSTIRINSGNEEEKFLPSRPNDPWIM
ncbi:chymotrypsinogen A-like [Physella acuta]|uniref:chymotrypsinogen A-like n=1 Tax=Physella acuta TaxID=109671 RepID=UPI0027DCDFC7|nr:chymotrypsinogen A-like [Physella acuta]